MGNASKQSRVLIFESDPMVAHDVEALLGFIYHQAVVVSGFELTSDLLSQGPFDVVMLGQAPEEVVVDLVKSVHDRDPSIPILIFNQTEAVFHAAKKSAASVMAFIEMPLHYEPLVDILKRAAAFRERVREENPNCSSCQSSVSNAPTLIGNSAAMQNVRKMIEQVSQTYANVLILGESGTGKEVVARNIHALSERCGQAFVPVNCGAIPSDLLESELFGHEKGAFTGAISARQGRFELAQKGTLFLDEIGDMSLPMQVKLLRVLQERTFERVGSNKSLNADVRILAATHRHLEARIGEGKFREDLFYRLNVFPIEIPALRERLDDVPFLIQDQVARLEKEGRGAVRLTADAIDVLCHYSWPGNVRELANLVERLAILYPHGVVNAQGLPAKFTQSAKSSLDDSQPFLIAREEENIADIVSIFSQNTPAPTAEVVSAAVTEAATDTHSTVNEVGHDAHEHLPSEGLDLKDHLAHLEVDLIKQALDASDGVVAHAAKLLKMRRTTLVEKLRKYGLQKTA